MMKKRFYLILTLSCLLATPFSCESSPYMELTDMQVCNVDNPLEDLKWLKDIKHSIQLSMSPAGTQIIQYTYKGEYVFWVDMCYQCADGLISVYNCQGEVICVFGGIDGRNTCADFETEATESTMFFLMVVILVMMHFFLLLFLICMLRKHLLIL